MQHHAPLPSRHYVVNDAAARTTTERCRHSQLLDYIYNASLFNKYIIIHFIHHYLFHSPKNEINILKRAQVSLLLYFNFLIYIIHKIMDSLAIYCIV